MKTEEKPEGRLLRLRIESGMAAEMDYSLTQHDGHSLRWRKDKIYGVDSPEQSISWTLVCSTCKSLLVSICEAKENDSVVYSDYKSGAE